MFPDCGHCFKVKMWTWTWTMDYPYDWLIQRMVGVALLWLFGFTFLGIMSFLRLIRMSGRAEMEHDFWTMDDMMWEALYAEYLDRQDDMPGGRLEQRRARALKKIPRILTPQRNLTEDDLKVQDFCVICLEMFTIGETVPQIPHPCLKNSNFIHNACLERWFKETAQKGSLRCPVCRGVIK